VKKRLSTYIYITLCVLASFSCSTSYTRTIYEGPPPVNPGYGIPVTEFPEGLHTGIDYVIPPGTPIIAVSDGRVIKVSNPADRGELGNGVFVLISHEPYFWSVYGHLIESVVEPSEEIKRGELIGFSGTQDNSDERLHFGITKVGGASKHYSQTYDPNNFWLGKKPQCFDPQKDYSSHSAKEITLPVACGEYQKRLLKVK
jgi:murein DD-endopeptidase MepM/ murein hydrolase activator NlpD